MAKRTRRAGRADSIVDEVRLLDVGPDTYGDCILCRIGGKTILIDGAHQGDDTAADFNNITRQLTSLLGAPPFKVDLLVVTHAHIDHTGCLPSLVKAGKLKAKDALVADPEMGWGPPEGVDAPTGRRDRIAMALREERFLSDDVNKISEFLDAAGGLLSRYVAMLDRLKTDGANVVRYRRSNKTKVNALVTKYRAATGLTLLGPSFDHLEMCHDLIKTQGRDTLDALGSVDASISEVDAYLTMLRSSDAGSVSAAINDQSMVLVVGKAPNRVLLTGDMQFGDPEVSGLEPEVAKLIKKISQDGPYVMVKLAHHGSFNASSQDLLKAIGPTQFFSISTGSASDKHPYLSTLDLIRDHGVRIGKDVRWGRTDRNGTVAVRMSSPIQAEKGRGSWNDYTKPADFDYLLRPAAKTSETPTIPSAATTAATTSQFEPSASASLVDGVIEILARIPHAHTRVTLTVEVEPLSRAAVTARSVATSPQIPKAPDGPPIVGLLVLTDAKRLADATTPAAADAAIAALEARGARVVSDFPGAASEPARLAFARDAITRHSAKGLLLLGGYDVVPPIAIDTLDEELRAELGQTNDPDDFIVWGDDPYADADESAVPDVPVSRLPDGHSPDLLMAALKGPGAANGNAYVLRNHFRPFAGEVFTDPNHEIDVSHPYDSGRFVAQRLSASKLYFMLHGDDGDASRYWGETPGGGALEAIRVDQIRNIAPGAVILAGCCWGAMIGDRAAFRCNPGEIPAGRTPEQSIALRCLAAGAKAFVGCTGAHYSPVEPPYAYFGGPIHTDFWNVLADSGSPATALFQAKQRYADAFPHGRERPLERAIERKILRQFTCLGIGW